MSGVWLGGEFKSRHQLQKTRVEKGMNCMLEIC